MAIKEIDFNWKRKYSNLKDFYNQEYDAKYFNFNRFELDIDPSETIENVEEYSVERQQKEKVKCAISFSYWCHKYVKITHPQKGLLPFILFKYQKRVIEEYEKHRYCILSKFRQGGLTTVTTIWCLWRCLFKLDETIMVISKSDREAIAAGEIVKRALEELPSWMRPEMTKNNDHQKIFSDTGCKMFFYTPEAARGRSITYLVLDEAAFVPQMEKHWKAMFPTLSGGGHCIVISTVNGVGNWYYDIFQGAKRDENDFHIIELDYWEHPEYNDPDWVKSTRAQLGEKGWMQEVMRDFLGAGESYFPQDAINDLDIKSREIRPMRMLFPKWNNLSEAKEERVVDVESWERGALHIWREPIDGREYILGVDSAEGMGGENDNSCIEVIDQLTCEQVAEFYSNTCPPHNFAQIVAMLGKSYNNALVIVESQSVGLAVLEKLQHDFLYENLYESSQGTSKNPKPGIKTTSSNRNHILETLQTRVVNNSIIIRSKRLVKEMKGFIWNPQLRRPQAAKDFHDDAIMAMCLALYARDGRLRNGPVTFDKTQESISDSFKAEILEEIKRELSREAPEDWIDPESKDLLDLKMEIEDYSDDEVAALINIHRPHNAVIREFGW